MAATLRLRIVTPERTILDEDVRSVQFMGIDGAYGILANHAPLMTACEPGVLSYEREGGDGDGLVITDGFVEMRNNTLTVVCESGEELHSIDVERAREAERKARELLADRASLASEEVIRAEAALRRSLARQFGANRARGGGRADV